MKTVQEGEPKTTKSSTTAPHAGVPAVPNESKAGRKPEPPWKLLEEVREPGAYIRHQSGDLLRIPRGGRASADTGDVLPRDDRPVYVLKISDDPFIRISRARLAAANLDVEVNF